MQKKILFILFIYEILKNGGRGKDIFTILMEKNNENIKI